MKSETINKWEQVAKDTPKSYKEFFEKERIFLEKNIPKDSIILDVGCGEGRMFDFFSKLGKKIVAIDNDEKSINKSQKKINELNLKNVKVVLQDAESTKFEEGYFDVIAIIGTFCNFGKTKSNILKEMKRILKKDGLLFITAYNENALEERLKLYKKVRSKVIEVKDNGTVILDNDVISEQFSEKQLKDILEKSGFRVEKIEKGKIYYLVKAQK